MRNATPIDRAGRWRTSELGTEWWANGAREVEDGRLWLPVILSLRYQRLINLTPRFAITEQHGDGHQAVWAVDGLRASGEHAITDKRDTAAPDSLNCMIELAVYFLLLSPGVALQAAPADFRHA